ncbi:MAG: phosphatidylglycerophosphatase A family protein [Terriglobia bacterium]
MRVKRKLLLSELKIRTGPALTDRRPGAAVRIATCWPVGFLPIAPGTGGSAIGVALVYGLSRLLAGSWHFRPALGALVVGVFFLGVWTAGESEAFFGIADPAHVVIDEVAGQMIAFLAGPHDGWPWLLAGFVLFRFFDVIKPFPARRAEHLRAGWGIMTDDVIAGVYAAVVMFLLGCLT